MEADLNDIGTFEKKEPVKEKRKYVKSGKYKKILTTENELKTDAIEEIKEIPKEKTEPVDEKKIETETKNEPEKNNEEQKNTTLPIGMFGVIIVSTLTFFAIIISNKFAKKKQPISDAKLTKEEDDYLSELFQKAYGIDELPMNPKQMFWLSAAAIAATRIDYSKF